MVDQGTPTIVPPSSTSQSYAAPAATPRTPAADTRNDFLFDSIAKEGIENEGETTAPWKSAVTGLLWVGYGIAVIVAVVLVWSAAKELLQ